MGELEEMLQRSRRYYASVITRARMYESQQQEYDAEQAYKRDREKIFDICENRAKI